MSRITAALLSATLLLLPCISQAQGSPEQRLAQATRFETISHQDRSQIDYLEFERLLQFLRESFPRVFSELQVETVNDYSLLIRWPGTSAAFNPVLFTAHTDVVPIEPGTEQDWQHPPFAGVVADGTIYGRGTLDDKQGVMAWLEAAEQLLEQGYEPQRSLVFAFGHDEEISGVEGAAALAERMRELDLHFEWLVDEGGFIVSDYPVLPGRPVALINIAEKGYLTLTLTAQGEGGHSSMPPKVSTIGRLANALAKIEANPFPPRLVEPVKAMFESLAPHVGQPESFIFSNLWLSGGVLANNMAEERDTASYVRTTTALTMFNAGIKENVVPQKAVAKVNFRLLPGDTPDWVVGEIRQIIDDDQIEISYDEWDNTPPAADHRASGFGVIGDAVAAVYPDVVTVPSILTATTDTRHYIGMADDMYRFHGVLISTTQGPSVHGTNEFLAVDSYLKSIDVARELLQRAGSPP